MSQAQIQVLLAGIAFGAWPLIYNRGGVHWSIGLLTMTVVTLTMMIPIMYMYGVPRPSWQWGFPAMAGVVVTIGLFFFNDMLQKTPATEVAPLVVLTIVVQIAVTLVYHLSVNGHFSMLKLVGFALAVGAAFCLA